jgi:hypothetical protein
MAKVHYSSLAACERQQAMSKDSTKKDYDDYEVRDEYDSSQMPVMPKGRYAPEQRKGKNVVVLAPDVAQAFPSDEAVNAALRLVLQISKFPLGASG